MIIMHSLPLRLFAYIGKEYGYEVPRCCIRPGSHLFEAANDPGGKPPVMSE